jgi:tetratricopeptide (TPR) repeat protein
LDGGRQPPGFIAEHMKRALPLILLLTMAGGPADPTQAMLDALQKAPTPLQASALESKIEAAWQAMATPAVQLLVENAVASLQHNGAQSALADLDAAVDLQPSLADLWRLRAQARFATGDAPGAAADLAQALSREPRSFTALADLSRIAEARKDYKSALLAWKKFMHIDPHAAGADQRLDHLQRQVSGEPL